jgi:cobalt-zinc-cadmium efflux system protein
MIMPMNLLMDILITISWTGRPFACARKLGTAFAVGIALNTIFIVVEAIYGYISNSTALVADAGHNLSDVLGLIVAWIAIILSKRPPSDRYTYGLRASSILAALFNAVFLLIAVGAIGWQAVLRLFNPEPVAEVTVMVVATIGIVINGFTAWLFASGRKSDLNIQGAYLHIRRRGDLRGVVIAALVIMYTGWLWLDAVTSLIIVAIIVWGTWGFSATARQCRSALCRPISILWQFAATSNSSPASPRSTTFISGR